MPELPLGISVWLLWKRREISLKHEKKSSGKREKRVLGSAFGGQILGPR